MENIGVKTIVIAVGIFVTLLILTVVLLEFDHISNIYKKVGETDTSFEATFDELDKFRDSNNIFTSLDVRNYVKKYENDDTIDICVDGNCDDSSNIATLSDFETSYNEYTAELEYITNGYRINFYIK